jgi:hypothetical protein
MEANVAETVGLPQDMCTSMKILIFNPCCPPVVGEWDEST